MNIVDNFVHSKMEEVSKEIDELSELMMQNIERRQTNPSLKTLLGESTLPADVARRIGVLSMKMIILKGFNVTEDD